MKIELLSGFIILIMAGIGWCGYYLEVQDKIRQLKKFPENIREIYLGSKEI